MTGSLVGRTIGKIRIVGLLGQGGMGAVYRGFDETLERDLAVKVIHELEQFSDVARARFLQEARILSKLEHPNICQIHDYIEADDQHLLLLELIDGIDLREAMERGLDPPEAFRVAKQLLDALAAAHAKGIVHRDLKPRNVMLTRDGDVKVLDFGLARWERQESAETALEEALVELDENGVPTLTDSKAAERSRLFTTQRGAIIGTLAYMSPEQARGEPVGPSSDIYSAGLLLQEVFTGNAAREKGVSFAELLQRTARGETRPVEGLDADLTEWIEGLEELAPGSRPSARDARRQLEWIEEAPKRQIRKKLTVAAFATLSILVAALAVLSLLVSRSHEAAEHARGQAEGLVNFMLEDLYEELQPLGRTDLLREVAEKTRSYFEDLPADQREESREGTALALTNVGLVLQDQGILPEAKEAFTTALQLQEALLERDPTRTSWLSGLASTHQHLGSVQSAQGDLEGSLASWNHALEIQEDLVGRDSDQIEVLGSLAETHHEIGLLLRRRADIEGALKAWGRALELREDLHRRDPGSTRWLHGLAWIHNNIGAIRVQQGDHEGALASWQRALEARQVLVESDPENAEWQDGLAWLHFNMAMVRRNHQGDTAGALESYQRALAIEARLADQDPTNTKWQYGLAWIYNNIGLTHSNGGNASEALHAHETALNLCERLVARDPSNAEWRSYLGTTHGLIGAAHRRRGNAEGALKAFTRVLALIREPDLSSDVRQQADAADAHRNIGWAHSQQGARRAADEAFRTGLALAERIVEQDPSNTHWQSLVAKLHLDAGDAQRRFRDEASARISFQRAEDTLRPFAAESEDTALLATYLEALLSLGDVDAARSLLARFPADLARGDRRLSRLLKRNGL